VVQDVHVTSDVGAIEVPPVRYARVSGGGCVAYRVYGGGDLDLLNVKEWAASVDACWEHPAHLRTQQYQGSLARCAMFDPRGIGPSDPVAVDDLGDIDAWVQDAIAVMDAIGMDRVVLFGEGFAGHAAVALAVAHPERVEALVLANCSVCGIRTHDRPFGLNGEELDALVELVQAQWGTGAVVFNTARTLGSDERFREFCARFERTAASPSTAARWVRAAFSSDVTALLPQLVVRTLVLYTGELAHMSVEAARDLAARIPGARLLESLSSMYWFDDPQAARTYGEFMFGSGWDERGDRQLKTIMFTDIVASTDRVREHGDTRWTEVLEGIDLFVATTVRRYNGRLVKQTGDGHLATFDGPTDAVRAGTEIRTGVRSFGVDVRVGIHTAEIQVRPGGDVSGVAVHLAQRVSTLANPGEVLVSGTVKELVAGSGIAFEDRGIHVLKGTPDEWRLFAASVVTD
jgi:class 3 adenylate cyclase/pimeloyl-ACP methyl ester carboxylesterase